MGKRSLLLALALGLLSCGYGARDAAAGTVMVSEDEGTFNFTLKADGKGTISITYTGVLLTTINNALIPTGPIASTINAAGNEDLSVTPTVSAPPLTSYTLTEANPGNKSFGTGPDAISTATLQYLITTGFALPGFLNLNGSVTGVSSPLLQTTATGTTIYDFSPFSNGGQITLTYNKVGANFANVIAHGGTITGTGGFTQQAVPEPASMGMLCIGISGMLALRRYFKPAVVS